MRRESRVESRTRPHPQAGVCLEFHIFMINLFSSSDGIRGLELAFDSRPRTLDYPSPSLIANKVEV